jgi:1-acyl-sn-glycerol-3-phosphate acyltransferase
MITVQEAARLEEESRIILMSQIPDLLRRVGIYGTEAGKKLEGLFWRSLEAGLKKIGIGSCAGSVDSTPEGQELMDTLGQQLVLPDSRLIDGHHFEEALEFCRRGGNVLLVQNHTSGADVLATYELLNRHFDDVVKGFWWMSGHVVNLYPIPLMLSSALNRFQIFSMKYRSLAAKQEETDEETWMRAQNSRALRAVIKVTIDGGKIVVLYPEGGRGEHGLIRGVAETMCIPEAMSAKREVMVLPTYVCNATSVLPVVRTENEFSEFLGYATTGTVDLQIGKPYLWDTLQGMGKQSQADHIMSTIAEMAPTDKLRGIYANGLIATH